MVRPDRHPGRSRVPLRRKAPFQGGLGQCGLLRGVAAGGRVIEGDRTVWEREPLQRLVADGQLGVYCHAGFWMCMDTAQDRQVLEDLWSKGNAPWNVWEREKLASVSMITARAAGG